MKNLLCTLIAAFAGIAGGIVLFMFIGQKKDVAPIIQETVVVEQKIPVFKFVTYEYTIHTVEKITTKGKDIVIGMINSGDVTLLFEYFAKVEIDVDSLDILAAEIEPGKIDINKVNFNIKIVNPKFNYLGQLVSNGWTHNTIRTEAIFANVNTVSDRIRELVIADGGIELAKQSFMTQYKHMMENFVNVEFVNID